MAILKNDHAVKYRRYSIFDFRFVFYAFELPIFEVSNQLLIANVKILDLCHHVPLF